MTAPTHQQFGLNFGLLTLVFCQLLGIYPDDSIKHVIFIFLVIIGSLLPDLDTYQSKLGRRFPFLLISIPMYFIFGHRTITHSLLFVVLVGISSLSVVTYFDWSILFSIGLTLGVLSHVIGDFVFEGGVPLLYPNKQRYKPLMTLKTKGIGEKMVLFTLGIMNILLLFYLTQQANWSMMMLYQ